MSMRGSDFTTSTSAELRFSEAMVGGLQISSTGFRRESRRIHSAKRGVSATALCGRSTQVAGDDLPVVPMQGGGRHVDQG
jgi:hypothetical protein